MTNLRVHFAHRHTQDKISILEEDNQPYPWCPQCDMFMSHKSLNGQHMKTAFFRRGSDRKWRRLAEEDARVRAETEFTADGTPLALVISFKYLRQIFTAADNDWPAVASNLQKAR